MAKSKVSFVHDPRDAKHFFVLVNEKPTFRTKNGEPFWLLGDGEYAVAKTVEYLASGRVHTDAAKAAQKRGDAPVAEAPAKAPKAPKAESKAPAQAKAAEFDASTPWPVLVKALGVKGAKAFRDAHASAPAEAPKTSKAKAPAFDAERLAQVIAKAIVAALA